MHTTIFLRIATWLSLFIQMQLFISLICLPMLILWGLPLSLASPLGNLIFSPLLTVFLLLSCVLFFTELIGLPNGLFVTLLNKTTDLWLYLMSFAQKKWLIGFAQPSFLVLLLIPLLALACIHNKYFNTRIKSIGALVLLFATTCCYLEYSGTTTDIAHIMCNKGHVTFIKHNNNTVLIDPGVIGQRLSAPSWIEFTLLPEIIKQYGCTHFDYVITLQPSKLTFDALTTLCQKSIVKNLYIPYWQGTTTKSMWRSFFQLKEIVEKNNVKLVRLYNKNKTLFLSQNNTIVITPEEKKITVKDITYAGFNVTSCVDNQRFTLYSQKLKNKKGVISNEPKSR